MVEVKEVEYIEEYLEGVYEEEKALEGVKDRGELGGLEELEKDELLYGLITRIQQDIMQVNSLIAEVRKGGIVPDIVTSDLNHIKEIEYDRLTDEQKLKLLEHMKKTSDVRRVNKNIFTVGNILGEEFKKLDKYFTDRMTKVHGVLDTDKKHYRIKGVGTAEIFEDIMGYTVEETRGRYIDISEHVDVHTGKVSPEGKRKAYEIRKKYKEDDEEKKEVQVLKGKAFENELQKVSGRKKKRNKKKKKK